jgi:hypothetical protein
MKNRGEDAYKMSKRCTTTEVFFWILVYMPENKKPAFFVKNAG